MLVYLLFPSFLFSCSSSLLQYTHATPPLQPTTLSPHLGHTNSVARCLPCHDCNPAGACHGLIRYFLSQLRASI
ncbi:hypothetical protein F5883DRAFT_549592 [Diaporthe sp. PMI_573]|nr:hypothetical protein F5883DRAFT_549592 [Diaporthaceae sp. PMI_573]